jgi:hypothetical protein
MKKWLFALGLILSTGCSGTQELADSANKDLTNSGSESGTDVASEYVLFTVNTQEFVYDELSAGTLNRLLDVHEYYQVPLDVYLTADILRHYEEMAPELVERLKDSALVAVSYHERPPMPSHSSAYDFLGLEDMPQEELYQTLLAYEEFATDPVTGESTTEPGGYEYVKDVIGYAPVVVGMASERKIADTLGQIYKEKGATFVVAHGDDYSLGEQRYGLFLRPENWEVILTEYSGQDPSVFIPKIWEEGESGQFMNIKVHDNDFIASDSAWVAIYLKQKPPYRLERGTSNRSLLSTEESEAFWKLYEDCVKYVSEHSSQYQAINAFDLQKMLTVISST